MKVLIGCETSGEMLTAFRSVGCDAWSVDLLPSDIGSPYHIVGDVRDHLDRGWDLGIFHPTCTRLCRSGERWLHHPPSGKTREQIQVEFEEGVALFLACWRAPIPKKAIENPRMNRPARLAMPPDLPKPQIVQPWWFGEPAFKATGFYLHNLRPLVATNILPLPQRGSVEHKQWEAIFRAPPSPMRWKIRSRTFRGIALACADQWGRA